MFNKSNQRVTHGHKMRTWLFASVSLISLLSTSCKTTFPRVSHVTYQSIRTTFKQPDTIPANAEIVVWFRINEAGEITPIIQNLTDEIMTIDNTRSFFVSPDGKSTSYYDPTIRTTSVTNSGSSTVARAQGSGSTTSVYGSNSSYQQRDGNASLATSTSSYSVTNVETVQDLPTASIGPRGSAAMAKSFPIGKFGIGFICANPREYNIVNVSPKESFCKFSVSISYSLNGGQSYRKMTTDFYCNSYVSVPVVSTGNTYNVNNALRKILQRKPDALSEECYLLYICPRSGMKNNKNRILANYQ